MDNDKGGLERSRDVALRVVRLGSRPIAAVRWDLRRTIQEYPLRGLAVAIAIGYVVGKLLPRLPKRRRRT